MQYDDSLPPEERGKESADIIQKRLMEKINRISTLDETKLQKKVMSLRILYEKLNGKAHIYIDWIKVPLCCICHERDYGNVATRL
jgi:hypothetical protein